MGGGGGEGGGGGGGGVVGGGGAWKGAEAQGRLQFESEREREASAHTAARRQQLSDVQAANVRTTYGKGRH